MAAVEDCHACHLGEILASPTANASLPIAGFTICIRLGSVEFGHDLTICVADAAATSVVLLLMDGLAERTHCEACLKVLEHRNESSTMADVDKILRSTQDLFVMDTDIEAIIERHGERLRVWGSAKRIEEIENCCRQLASFE